MARLSHNIIANLSGRVLTAVLGLVFVPIIVKMIGIEAYGLVAFLASVQAFFSLLDLGLSATINRELAQVSARRDAAQDARDLVRTLEICYWGIAIVITVSMLALAPAITAWVTPGQLSPDEVRRAVLVMVLVVALQWPLSFYDGGLMGLQRQVASNAVSVSMMAVRQVGALLVLFVSPTVSAYLAWQACSYGMQTLLTAWLLWRSLPRGERRARFQTPIFRGVWRFAAGITGTSIVSLGLTQMDRIVLSGFLSLEDFGYYSLAAVAANGLHYLIGPVYAAAFPRFSELVAAGDTTTLRLQYHRISQFASALVLPVALVLMVFADDVLQLWLHDPATVARTHRLLTILAAGTLFNALVHVPYALQLANGWTSLQMYTNAIALCVLTPLAVVFAQRFGAPGVAAVWVILNATYILVVVPIMHRRLLPGDLWRWYGVDVALPLAAAGVTVLMWRIFPVRIDHPVVLAVYLAAVSGSAFLAAFTAAPATRALLVSTTARWTPAHLSWSRPHP